MSFSNSKRLNKYISESGMCSRREADRYIAENRVTINGKTAKIGDQVFPRDKVKVNGMIIEPKDAENEIFLAFNKPAGVTSTTELSDRSNIINYVNHTERIFPIGRLDKDSQGLIFLTNNGDIVNKILRAGNQHEKEYIVTVNKPVSDEFITAMANGVPVLGQTTKKCTVTKEGQFVFKIILIQGMNRQIRRMCEYFGYEVTKLVRVRIMNIGLKGLPEGDWRELTKDELAIINKMVEESASTEDDTKHPKKTKKHTPEQGSKSPQKKSGNKPFWKTKQQGGRSGQAKSRSSRGPGNSGRPSKGKGRGRKKDNSILQ